jgi:hypothetical protein
MGRLRIRDNNNSSWIDICQSEWRIKQANGTWRRVYPRDIKGRHGKDQYWCQINCASDGGCADDPYGGIGTDNPDHPTNGGTGGPNFGPIVTNPTPGEPVGSGGPKDWDGNPIEPPEPSEPYDPSNPPSGPTQPPTTGNPYQPPLSDPSDPNPVYPPIRNGGIPSADPYTPLIGPNTCYQGEGDYEPGCGIGTPKQLPDGTTCVILEGGTQCLPVGGTPKGEEPAKTCPLDNQFRYSPVSDPAASEVVWKIGEFRHDIGRRRGKLKIGYNFEDVINGTRAEGRIEIMHLGHTILRTVAYSGHGEIEIDYQGSVSDGVIVLRLFIMGNTNRFGYRLHCVESTIQDVGIDPVLTNPPDGTDPFVPPTGSDDVGGYNDEDGYGPDYEPDSETGGPIGADGLPTVPSEPTTIIPNPAPNVPNDDGTVTDAPVAIKNPDGTIEGLHDPTTPTVDTDNDGIPDTVPDSPGTSGEAGTWNDPLTCPTTAMFGGTAVDPDGTVHVPWDVGEFIVSLGPDKGTVLLPFTFSKTNGSPATGRIEVIHRGIKIGDTGAATGAGRISFEYDPGANPSENRQKVLLRVRRGDAHRWGFRIGCPIPAREMVDTDNDGVPDMLEPTEGDPDAPAACGGTFEPAHGGNIGVHDMFHEMSGEEGEVIVDFQMWFQPDTLEVWYQGSKLATTGGFVSGVGQVRFNFKPNNGDNRVLVRVISNEAGTSWVYVISCPGELGSKTDPRPCSQDDGVLISLGQSRNDTYWDLGYEAGVINVLYQMYYTPDSIAIYDKDDNLLAGNPTEGVSGTDTLSFSYEPHMNPLHVVMLSHYEGNWGYKIDCPVADPEFSVVSGIPQREEGNAIPFTVVLAESIPIEVSVAYELISGTATVGADVEDASGRIIFPPNTTSQTIYFDTFDDDVNEPYESFTFRISDPSHGVIRQSDNKGTILDNDWPLVACGTYRSFSYSNPGVNVQLGSTAGNVVLEYETNGSGGPGANRFEVTIDGKAFMDTGYVSVPAGDKGELSVWYDPADFTGTVAKVEITGDAWSAIRLNCPTPAPTYDRKIFGTTAETNSEKSQYVPPTAQEVFDTWHRTDGRLYYKNKDEATGNAALWSLEPAGNIRQNVNSNTPLSLLNPRHSTEYHLQARITSEDADDDVVGLVLCSIFDDDEVLHQLVAMRTKGGDIPLKGWGIVYMRAGQHEKTYYDVSVGGTAGGWSNDFSLVRISRSGNQVIAQCGTWNSRDISSGTAFAVDLNYLPAFKDKPSSYGYYTFSQKYSTYFNPDDGGQGDDSSIFDASNGEIWDYMGGEWVRTGTASSWTEKFGTRSIVRNPETGQSWSVENNVRTKN